MASSLTLNPRRGRTLDSNRVNFPRAFHVRLPDAAPTPLLDLAELATELGLGHVWLKDESRRYQMHGYELLGAGWALYREVLGRLQRRVRWDSVEDLVAKIDAVGPLRIVAVSDDEFGVAAARAARLLGFAAAIYVPAEMDAARVAAVEAEGAEVVAVAGGYDAALAAAAVETGADTVILSDSSWAGFDEIPSWVTEGYTTVFEEAIDEIERRGAPAPDAVFVPLGTGALAAAAGAYFRVERFGPDLWLGGVEPVAAACFSDSVAAGARVALPHPAPSALAGLARGLPSPLAWESVTATFDAFVAIDDDRALTAVDQLARSGVIVSAAGAAGLAGLQAAMVSAAAAGIDLPLGPDRSVLLVATESPRR